MRSLIIVLSLLSGCGGSFQAPTPVQASRIEEARALILRSDLIMPFEAKTASAWFRERVDKIYIDDTTGYLAYRQNGNVFLSSEAASLPLIPLTGVLMHEARHADVSHSCGLSDKTLSEWGAWGVQAWWLDQMGLHEDAKDIGVFWICLAVKE